MDDHPYPTEIREYLYKILVIGDLGTGKTSIIKRYVHNIFSTNYKSTVSLNLIPFSFGFLFLSSCANTLNHTFMSMTPYLSFVFWVLLDYDMSCLGLLPLSFAARLFIYSRTR